MELRNITFTSLVNWSVQYLLEATFSYNPDYKLVPIGKFLTRNKTPVNIEDGIEYKRVTIRGNNLGVYLRDKEKGENIGTKKQFIVKKDQFLVSKIDARNGAFGVIPDEVDSAIITGNFWTFDVDESVINPHFLSLIVTTPEFIRFCENASNGTTNRHYLQEDLFLAQPIPLPSLPEQNRIVAEYDQKIQLGEQQEQESDRLVKEIEIYLYKSLKIVGNVVKPKEKGLQYISFNKTSRWDTLFLKGSLPILKSTYPVKRFEDIILKFNRGPKNESIRMNSQKYPSDEFIYIGMEHVEKETGNLLDIIKVKGNQIKSQTLKVPRNYLIYGKLRPYLNKYWLNDTAYDNIICSSEFFVFDTKKEINKEFFKYVLASSFVQEQISDKTSGARMPRINETIFYNLQFPLPTIEKQEEMAKHLNQLKNQIKLKRASAVKNKEEALLNFEQEIFSS